MRMGLLSLPHSFHDLRKTYFFARGVSKERTSLAQQECPLVSQRIKIGQIEPSLLTGQNHTYILIFRLIYYKMNGQKEREAGELEVLIDGKKIHYEVDGEGYPVVLLHGWLANLRTMQPIANGLKQKFKVYNIDIIGFGESDLPDSPMTTDDYGNFLKKLVDALKIESPILIGHSNGGRIIINAVGRGVVSPKKVVLIDSAGLKPKRKLNYYIKVYTFKLGKNILKILPATKKVKEMRESLRNKFSSEDYKNSPEVLRRTMSIILNEDQRKYLPSIKVPTLLIWGENDTATPIIDAKTMENLIPDAGLVTYKNSGHFSYLENLQNCNIVLNEFLKQEAN